MEMAGQYGSALVLEIESLQQTNTQLRMQVVELQEAASAAAAHDLASHALADFVRAELQTATHDRGLGSPTHNFHYTGQLSADFSTFQALLRAQRRSYREERAHLQEELEATKHTAAEQQASIQSLTASQARWSALQTQHNALQQAHDEKDIICEELRVKLQLQASQHASMQQLLNDQLAAAREEARAELEKTRESEKQRRAALEKQIVQLKAQLPQTAASEDAAPKQPMSIVVTSSAGVRTAMPTTSLADDLATASESPRAAAASEMPTIVVDSVSESGVLTSFQLGRLGSQLDSMFTTETQRQETRDGWHQTESLWFFERARAREAEAQAEDMRREARAEELSALGKLADGKEAQLTVDHLREQLKQSQEREAELREGQGHVLTQTVAALTSQLSDKEEELAQLRLSHSVHAPRTPSKSPSKARSYDDSDTQLSTPVLRASRHIAESHRFTPPVHNRAPDFHPPASASPAVHPIQTLMPATAPASVKPDTQLRSGVRDVAALTQSVLREVQGASRSSRWFISGLFLMQLVVAMVWLLLTSGGSGVLGDHPLVQALLAFVDNTTPDARFQS